MNGNFGNIALEIDSGAEIFINRLVPGDEYGAAHSDIPGVIVTFHENWRVGLEGVEIFQKLAQRHATGRVDCIGRPIGKHNQDKRPRVICSSGE